MSRVLIRVGPGAWKQPPWERSAPACHVPDAWKQELQVPVVGTRYSKILEREGTIGAAGNMGAPLLPERRA